MMPDADLTQRLYDSGAKFSGEIIQQADPLLSFLLTWVLPIVIFVAVGQLLYRRMVKNAGGPNAMSFGMGKSNAKIYVKSSGGIRFSDVAGEDEAKETCRRLWIISIIRINIRKSAHPCPRESCWWALREPARPCWPKRWPGRPMSPSSPCPARNSWRCLWAWAHPRSGICSGRPRKKPPALCLLMRLMP